MQPGRHIGRGELAEAPHDPNLARLDGVETSQQV